MLSLPERSALDVAMQGLLAIGYAESLLRRDYQFAETVRPVDTVHSIPLAAFAQEPSSYRTACIGVCVARPDMDLAAYRSLGAPLLLEVADDEVRRWKMTAEGAPELLERIVPEFLHETIIQHGAEWGPNAILRTRSIAFDNAPVQLDFYDIGLIPVIESHVRRKLDLVLRDTVAATRAVHSEHHVGELDYAGLFRLIFRLLAAKLLGDRGFPGNWLDTDPDAILHAVQRHYTGTDLTQPVLDDPAAKQVAWARIRSSFHLQNISVETLAYIYENTFVTPEHRRRLGIHSTPPEVAEYLVQQLPFDILPNDERRVFEPFTGHGALLLAALSRLRNLLPAGTEPQSQHRYLVDKLAGLEVDAFAVEISRMSLMLADYPNPNGWRLSVGDVFVPGPMDTELDRASVVLCNPPFEDFTPEERAAYPDLQCVNKAAETLRRVLQKPPGFLGFVLPRSFPDGSRFRAVRRQLAQTYDDLQQVALPDNAFAHSGIETVLLLAHGRATKPWMRIRAGFVRKDEYGAFTHSARLSADDAALVERASVVVAPRLWLADLQQIWEYLGDLPLLNRFADIHRGIEYRLAFDEHYEELVAASARSGFEPGIARVDEGFEPLSVQSRLYLNTTPSIIRRAARLPWHLPKVLANAARLSRGHWVLSGAPDRTGLVAYQRFIGLWPTGNLTIEVIAAILNGPVANAFMSEDRTSRDNRVKALRAIPVPRLTPARKASIATLVQDYGVLRRQWLHEPLEEARYIERCREIIEQLDAELLAAYDLPPRLERQLLSYFSGQQRPGPVPFSGYFPPGFRPAIPWRLARSGSLLRADAQRTLARLPVLHDAAISEALAELSGSDE